MKMEMKRISWHSILKNLSRYHLQTSYNDNFRVRYAGVGYTYDSTLDAFIPIKPYDSWVLDNSHTDWIEPLNISHTYSRTI